MREREQILSGCCDFKVDLIQGCVMVSSLSTYSDTVFKIKVRLIIIPQEQGVEIVIIIIC